MAYTLAEKIERVKVQIRQLENRRKQLVQQQREQMRKARTKRHCSRMEIFEKMLPETISLTDEQFVAFLEMAVADGYGHRLLASILAQNESTPASAGAAECEKNTGRDS